VLDSSSSAHFSIACTHRAQGFALIESAGIGADSVSAQLDRRVRVLVRAIGFHRAPNASAVAQDAPLRRTHRQVHGTPRGNRSRRVPRPNDADSIASLVKHVINVVFSHAFRCLDKLNS